MILHMNEQFKRIILDIRDLQKSPIENIHYFPLEEDITIGHAVVFGPEGTPYEHGNYLFQFHFPKEYPYEPPKLTYLTNDGQTRFNPNFYRDGKVCLSLLNTWQGEKWSACQSIRSILITLQMTMNEKPLLNEPGINEDMHFSSIRKYNRLIAFKNVELTIIHYNESSQHIPIQREEIKQVISEHFSSTRDKVIDRVQSHIGQSYDKSSIRLNLYSQNAYVDYERLFRELNAIE